MPHVLRFIDVGIGTGAWSLDFVWLPEAHKSNIRGFACDISNKNFPQVSVPAEKQITLFQQDIIKPFPDEPLGTFDLINLTFVRYALTLQWWKLSLQNMRSFSLLSDFLLRFYFQHKCAGPGGDLVFRDCDIIMRIFRHRNFTRVTRDSILGMLVALAHFILLMLFALSAVVRISSVDRKRYAEGLDQTLFFGIVSHSCQLPAGT